MTVIRDWQEELPTVENTCILTGPGYGQCWGCPVLQCPLNIPPNPVTALASGVAAKAAERLRDNRTVVYGSGGRTLYDHIAEDEEGEHSLEEAAATLAEALWEPEVEQRLRARQAAEAVVQGVLEGRISSKQDTFIKKWFKTFAFREPTWDEVNRRDINLEHIAADVAAEVYGADRELVRKELASLRGTHLKVTDEYRRDHGSRRRPRPQTDWQSLAA